MLFRNVAIIGVGLLGGSLGLALRQRQLAGQVRGFVRRAASVAECLGLGAMDTATTDLAEAVRGADLVVLCTPIGQMSGVTRQLTASLKPGAIVTDVGSVKHAVVGELEPACAACGASFVGSHPMAGSERAGVAAARADLFQNAVCVVTSTAQSDPAALVRVEEFWRALGARLMRLAPELHDQMVARASHLPQAVAATLAHLVLDPASPLAQSQLCAGGFRDTTRIASGSPEMWRDILLTNRAPLMAALDEFGHRLGELRQAVEAADSAAIERFLETAKRRRDGWLKGVAEQSIPSGE